MKKNPLIFFITPVIALFSSMCFSQTVHIVESSGFTFSPKNITVQVGDTVRWKNVDGNHNVVADDGSFTSGAPSTSAWIYDHVFTSPGQNPYYCEIHGGPGGVDMSGNVTVESLSAVGDEINPLTKFQLKQNYPNPFNPTTNIQYTIGTGQFVQLKVYDAVGNEVATIVNEKKPAGNYVVNFNAENLGSGIYYYQLKTKDFIQTRKMIVLK